jgi:diguanylate cyclase (GGDEF)-like protein
MASDAADSATVIQAEDYFAGLSDYQRALSGHMDWLRGWYSAVLNWESGGVEALPICPFESWFASAGDAILGGFPGFAVLGGLHREIHDKADRITARAESGQTVTTSDYETMMALVLAFGTAAQALERDVWRTLATVDPLTGLGNRQTMMTQLLGERDRVIRLGQPCCIGLADIDHFKRINDTFGHATGDRVLRAVADCLRNAVRPYDILYRYGGEEFLVCLPAASLESGAQVLERMRLSVAALSLTDADGRPIPVTATFGLASLSADISVEDSFELADNALYEGKISGRNCVLVHQARVEV